MTYANGTKYTGKYKNDAKEGKGTEVYNDGGKYDGEWKND